ncbi:methyltransferase domain-containing protein [Ancylobacter sonchi]|uniref:class I SAM-dependent methyltransferase n=1 Tax=Ancylobacter sonchi TaxID=1937790 RepID=UPI001BD1D2AD|nr:class I SAM-dependent methyltransferase [Ancylobacter sonchi]MBS7536745.1 methyltransferase domain-containing protein [Ancylobacter sonchi]
MAHNIDNPTLLNNYYGINSDLENWLRQNLLIETPTDRSRLAPFPPVNLMHNTSGLMRERDFASHGIDLVCALAKLSPRAPSKFGDLLDFGVGAGRLARMFYGYSYRYVGVDIDDRHIDWISKNLLYVETYKTIPFGALPFKKQSFDTIVSISVFSHLSEADHIGYLEELSRLLRHGGRAFISIHGARALDRALEEKNIFDLLSISRRDLERSRHVFEFGSGYNFIKQGGHLTTESYPYGITFISEDYIRSIWAQWFDIVKIERGAIHDFQDIVVLKTLESDQFVKRRRARQRQKRLRKEAEDGNPTQLASP